MPDSVFLIKIVPDYIYIYNVLEIIKSECTVSPTTYGTAILSHCISRGMFECLHGIFKF